MYIFWIPTTILSKRLSMLVKFGKIILAIFDILIWFSVNQIFFIVITLYSFFVVEKIIVLNDADGSEFILLQRSGRNDIAANISIISNKIF